MQAAVIPFKIEDYAELMHMACDFNQESRESCNKPSETENSLEELLSSLPAKYPEALPIIQESIAPQIARMEFGLQEYYIDLLKKRFKISKTVIKSVIEFAIQNIGGEIPETDEEEQLPLDDPEIIARVAQLANDPQLLKKQIDLVNQLGVANERLNAGLNILTINSCKLPLRINGSDALGIMNCGAQGSGKSVVLNTCINLYPKSMYFKFNSGSPASIIYMRDKLKHRALIIEEAQSLQKGKSADNQFTYSVRAILSEGVYKHQVTGLDSEGNRITKEIVAPGPMSVITTSIYSQSEVQLDDRMFFTHPDTSQDQTREIVKSMAQMASGQVYEVSQEELNAWKVFYYNLTPCTVVVPFAEKIAGHLVGNKDIPQSARRAFERVLSSIKTIGLMYQKQRRRDDQGRVIAEICDYVMAWQLIDKPFKENMHDSRYTDARLKRVKDYGPITPRKLADMEDVSAAAISDWTKKWIEKGVLCWTDKKGSVIEGESELRKVKSTGNVYLMVTGSLGLPTPFELTQDPDWDVEGALFKMHDLGVMEIEAVPVKSERDSVRDMLERQFEMECESKAHDQEVKKTLSKDLDLGAPPVDNSGNEKDRVKVLSGNEDKKINFDDSDFDLGIDLKVQPEQVHFSGFNSEY